MMDNKKNWSVNDSLNTYLVHKWSDGYFNINSKGNICVLPTKNASEGSIDISDIIEEVKKEGVAFPAVFRFHDVLRSQVKKLIETFNKTINEASFKGSYYGVYPVKVNQLREVVEEIVDIGSDFHYGLEAGSKPELLAVLAYNTNPKSLTILNGYKDLEYMRLAMLGKQIGKNIVIVIEKYSEIHHVIQAAEEFGIEPTLGVRAKLNTKATGKWSASSGDFAKFGLSVPEIIDLVNFLKAEKKLHWLKLFHFHVGSQIPDIRAIKECIIEGARIFANLIKMEVPLEFFDVGGGVGINYDGSRSNCASSTNYTLSDYIGDVVYILKEVCDSYKIEHPNIVSETGRAVAAHHSCVITNVFGHVNLTKHKTVETTVNENDHILTRNMKHLYKNLNVSNYQDIFNDACVMKDESISAFKLGVIGLTERSVCETLYWSICHQIIEMTQNEKYVPEEIKKLKTVLADKYLCNFSLFQSAPDSWAIEQILPIVPISRHLEEPINECTLGDITCDSDGKINRFIGEAGQRPTLKVHNLVEGEEYYMGLFLTGAYQDVMGDMHNLFGRLNEVHVYRDLTDPNDFYIEEIIKGNSAADVLKIMQYHPEEMSRKVKKEIELKVKSGEIKPRMAHKLAHFYEGSLSEYTYLKNAQS